MGQFFNFKFGPFVMYAIARHIQAGPSLELKTLPRFCPVSLSLSMSRDYFGGQKKFYGDDDRRPRPVSGFNKVVSLALGVLFNFASVLVSILSTLLSSSLMLSTNKLEHLFLAIPDKDGGPPT
jgi:hypothetical protein